MIESPVVIQTEFSSAQFGILAPANWWLEPLLVTG